MSERCRKDMLQKSKGTVCFVCASSPSYLKTNTVKRGRHGLNLLTEREYHTSQADINPSGQPGSVVF